MDLPTMKMTRQQVIKGIIFHFQHDVGIMCQDEINARLQIFIGTSKVTAAREIVVNANNIQLLIAGIKML